MSLPLVYVTGCWKLTEMSLLANSFYCPIYVIATLIAIAPVYTVALPGLPDWPAFLEWGLAEHVK